MLPLDTLACGNCAYYALWHKFPPTSSWVIIIPCWFLVLSIIRTVSEKKLSGIPTLYIAGPLVLAVFIFAPGMIGPPLGFWIPVCCIVGTISGLSTDRSTKFKQTLGTTTVVAILALLGFGAHDYVAYNQMPVAERQKLVPAWEAARRPKPNIDRQTRE